MRGEPRSLVPAGILLAALAGSVRAQAVDPLGRSVLFVRGADGTGGLGSGSTTQLSDIGDFSIAPGNTGFGGLRTLLEADGFQVSQLVESVAPLTLARLLPHKVVVMASNNKVYSPAEVQAFHQYVDAGGSALFISDANWGFNFGAAPTSDNQFLDRYGAQVYQDGGGTPVMARAEPGRYLLPDHPVLSGPDGAGGAGDVNAYDGEGVSPFAITTGSGGYQAVAMVSAQGLFVHLNTPNGSSGPFQPAGPNDAVMVVAETPDARVAGHFDRNTFFNPGGAGTSLVNWDNAQLALNLFRYLASVRAQVAPVGTGCGIAGTPVLSATLPALAGVQTFTLAGASPGAPGLFLVGLGPPAPLALPGGCVVQCALPGLFSFASPATNGSGGWTLPIGIPSSLSLSGGLLTVQAAVLVAGGPALGAAELSNGLALRLGYPQ